MANPALLVALWFVSWHRATELRFGADFLARTLPAQGLVECVAKSTESGFLEAALDIAAAAVARGYKPGLVLAAGVELELMTFAPDGGEA